MNIHKICRRPPGTCAADGENRGQDGGQQRPVKDEVIFTGWVMKKRFMLRRKQPPGTGALVSPV